MYFGALLAALRPVSRKPPTTESPTTTKTGIERTTHAVPNSGSSVMDGSNGGPAAATTREAKNGCCPCEMETIDDDNRRHLSRAALARLPALRGSMNLKSDGTAGGRAAAAASLAGVKALQASLGRLLSISTAVSWLATLEEKALEAWWQRTVSPRHEGNTVVKVSTSVASEVDSVTRKRSSPDAAIAHTLRRNQTVHWSTFHADR